MRKRRPTEYHTNEMIFVMEEGMSYQFVFSVLFHFWNMDSNVLKYCYICIGLRFVLSDLNGSAVLVMEGPQILFGDALFSHFHAVWTLPKPQKELNVKLFAKQTPTDANTVHHQSMLTLAVHFDMKRVIIRAASIACF
eukprot:473833_1